MTPKTAWRRILITWRKYRPAESLRTLKAMHYKTEYLQSRHWKRKRAAAVAYAGHRCQVCNAAGRLDVHHRTYDNLGREPGNDLTVLCRNCHSTFHGKGD